MIKHINGTPTYWKKFMHEVMEAIKQIRVPNFLLAHSWADSRWNDTFYVVLKVNGTDISEDEIIGMSYTDSCKLLKGNPVIVTGYFRYWVGLFKTIVLDGPLGKTIYSATRVEFQVRGSPHVHSFTRTLNAPHLSRDTKPLHTEWLDDIIKNDLPDPYKEPELFDLAEKYQIQGILNLVRNFKNKSFRIHYGRYFTNQTIIAKPLASNIAASIKVSLIEIIINVLGKVKKY